MEPLRVLLVDDEEDLVLAMAERLALRGLRVETATCAADAMDHLERDGFDVLILDVRMPGSGGLRLMTQVKRQHPGLPVILFTGHGSVADAERGMQEGAFDYVMKPIELDDLVEKIRRAAASSEEPRA